MPRRKFPLLPCLLLLLLAAALFSLTLGRYSFSGGEEFAAADRMMFWGVRAPRVAVAILIGAALTGAGSAYQAIFRNPMASPDILGASSGAGFGAALAITLHLNAFGVQMLALCCGVAAVALTCFLSAAISRDAGATVILVLTGMVVGSLFSAGISVIKYVGDPYDTLPAITFWLMGGLAYVVTDDLFLLLPSFLAGTGALVLLRFRLNVLSLGDEEAVSLGLDAGKLRLAVIFCATLLSSASVAVGGMIPWVGLIVPHLARMLVGSDYRKLLPVALVLGGVFLLVVDDFARCLFAMEIPIGVLSALAGAPFFIYLLYSGRRNFL